MLKCAMLITTGKVHSGRIELADNILPEGSKVTILAHEDDEAFQLPPDDEVKLLAAIEEAELGESIDASDLLNGLRTP